MYFSEISDRTFEIQSRDIGRRDKKKCKVIGSGNCLAEKLNYGL